MPLRLDEFSRRLKQRRSRRVSRRLVPVCSAVALVLRENDEQQTEVLLMRRARRAGDPWSGHMSFPGGRMDMADANTLRTAIRETHEETGLDLERCAEQVGRLSDVLTRRHEKPLPMRVTPWVFRISGDPIWDENHEVVELVWVPLAFLADPANREQMIWKLGRVRWPLPCYFFEGRRIWGLTLLMLDELIQLWSGLRVRDSIGIRRMPWLSILPRR